MTQGGRMGALPGISISSLRRRRPGLRRLDAALGSPGATAKANECWTIIKLYTNHRPVFNASAKKRRQAKIGTDTNGTFEGKSLPG